MRRSDRKKPKVIHSCETCYRGLCVDRAMIKANIFSKPKNCPEWEDKPKYRVLGENDGTTKIK